MLNDIPYVEASRALAERVLLAPLPLREKEASATSRVRGPTQDDPSPPAPLPQAARGDSENDDERLDMVFRLATGRHPRARELAILRAGLERHLARYRSDPEAAGKLIAVGESKPNKGLDPVRLAAFTVMSSTILNLDETITKE
jgi:hypothetical protein